MRIPDQFERQARPLVSTAEAVTDAIAPTVLRRRLPRSDTPCWEALQLPRRSRPALPVAHGIPLSKAHLQGPAHRNRELRVLADELCAEPPRLRRPARPEPVGT